jgi:hypothetical protein
MTGLYAAEEVAQLLLEQLPSLPARRDPPVKSSGRPYYGSKACPLWVLGVCQGKLGGKAGPLAVCNACTKAANKAALGKSASNAAVKPAGLSANPESFSSSSLPAPTLHYAPGQVGHTAVGGLPRPDSAPAALPPAASSGNGILAGMLAAMPRSENDQRVRVIPASGPRPLDWEEKQAKRRRVRYWEEGGREEAHERHLQRYWKEGGKEEAFERYWQEGGKEEAFERWWLGEGKEEAFERYWQGGGKEEAKKWRLENPEQAKKWRLENPEQAKALNKKWNDTNRRMYRALEQLGEACNEGIDVVSDSHAGDARDDCSPRLPDPAVQRPPTS